MVSVQELINYYVHGIIQQSHGDRLYPLEMFRQDIKLNVGTIEWIVMGISDQIKNVLIEIADQFSLDGNYEIALNFCREGSYLFPDIADFFIKEAQCRVKLGWFDKARKACQKAIDVNGVYNFDELLLIFDEFEKCGRLKEVCDLYNSLARKFPNEEFIQEKADQLRTSIRDEAEERGKVKNERKKPGSKAPSGATKTPRTGHTRNEGKTSKQQKREYMAKQKELERNIAEGKIANEEKVRKQEEIQEQKRKEKEEREKLRRQEEEEERKRREKEEHEKKMVKHKERVGKKSSKTSNSGKVLNAQAARSINTFRASGISSLNDMPKNFDHILKSGSHLRRVCPKCKTPRVIRVQKCNFCQSELEVWYKKIDTKDWIQPRKPPRDVLGAYTQCKHFQQGKRCVKSPCRFAHGQDEQEIWELCRVKGSESLKERRSGAQSLHKSWSCMTLNRQDHGNGRRSRTDSVSSLRSCQSSSSTPFGQSSVSHSWGEQSFEDAPYSWDVQSSEDPLSSSHELDSDFDVSSLHSQDEFYESSQDFVRSSTSSSQSNGMDEYVTASSAIPVESEDSDSKWTKVESNWAVAGKKKKKMGSYSPEIPCAVFQTVSTVLKQEKLRCNFCNIMFSTETELSHHNSDPRHRVNVRRNTQQANAKFAKVTNFRPPPDGVYMGRYKLCRRFEQGYCYLNDKCTFAHGHEERDCWIELYKCQVKHLQKLQEKQLLTESFSEIVRRRIEREGEHRVLKVNIAGITLKCSSDYEVKLQASQDQTWIFDVRIQAPYRLSQVAFLLETHLDKFKFLLRQEQNRSNPNMQSIQLCAGDFVENPTKQEVAVQFCVQFSSGVFGDFEQKLVFDFGNNLVLARTLRVSVVSEDICSNEEVSSSRTRYCRVVDWSVEKMELVLCKDLLRLDPDGLTEQYNIPDDLPDSSSMSVEFTRETYSKLWHDILYIEEKYIQEEVARYDIHDGKMTVVNNFKGVDEVVFAQPGELFGEIYLYDFLFMDEIAGHLISRSVMSVILRLKLDDAPNNKIYECYIKLKTPELVIIKLNEKLLEDVVIKKDQVIDVDIKFKYNRVPVCEMHQTIDMCSEKTNVLLPHVKNVSYKDKKTMRDWYMEKKPNDNQHEAIAMILDPSPTPPILLLGPFGTGKTFTLYHACVSILSESENNKVLICTHSNSAANIHLSYLHEKLREKTALKIRPLRLLNLMRKVSTISMELRGYCLIEETTNTVREPVWHEIRDHNVLITTLSTSRMLWKFCKDGLRFTHIMIDEAAQAMEPECIAPLVMADDKTKIVLAGDQMQIGPSAYSTPLWNDGFGPKRSLLERLFSHYQQFKEVSSQNVSAPEKDSTFLRAPYTVLLTENYRCHAKILKFPSDNFYGGKLVPKGDQSTYDLVPVLSFYTAQGVEQQVEGGLVYYNEAEVTEVVKRVKELVDIWPKNWTRRIGVVTAYLDQAKIIRDGLRKKGLGYIDVNTVETVQGKEYKALFISTVRTLSTCSFIEERNLDPSQLNFGFLSDPRFLNTAVTRAQSLLAVIGDPMSLCTVGECKSFWKDYLKRCDDNNGFYGCTLKTVMDFCLQYQPLDPSAHEFVPGSQTQNNGTSINSSVEGAANVSSEETSSTGIESSVFQTEENNTSPSTSCDLSSNALADEEKEHTLYSFVDGGIQDHDGSQDHGGSQDHAADETIQADDEGESSTLVEEDLSSCEDDGADKEENKTENISDVNRSVTTIFFRRDGKIIFDKIIQELVKACDETREKDRRLQDKTTKIEFPALNDATPVTSAPIWPNVRSHGTFSAGLRDGYIELGFHVKPSERLFRLTSGKSATGKVEQESFDDKEELSQEEMTKLLQENPTRFTKCTFRVDTITRGRSYHGELPTPDSPNIHIPGRIRGVFEDDFVVLELQSSAGTKGEKGEEGQEEKSIGMYQGVLRRLIELRERRFVCTVDRSNPQLMIPINKKNPIFANVTKTDEANIIPIYEIKDGNICRVNVLKKKKYEKALAGECVFVVKFLKWRLDCPYPLGLAVRHISHGKNLETGMEILYEEHNIEKTFSQQLLASVANFNENWQVPLSEKGRPVYRDNVFTIDPPESLDLDDAISVQSLGNGNYKLHIHIADVSYFVQPNTDLDEQARSRCTTYYPPRPIKPVPMLPEGLSEVCCSLLPGEDRLALTVSVEMTPDGNVVGETKIERSVVNSSRRLTYFEAQQIINEISENEVLTIEEARQIPVHEAIGIIHRIAQRRRELRLGEQRSLYHRKRDDCDDEIDQEVEAHELIEEVMVMANHLVAKHLLKKFPDCTPLRVQPPPKTSRVAEWRQSFQKFLNFSLGLEWLGDTEDADQDNIEFMVPFTTWSMIMHKVKEGSRLEELAKLVCNLDLFPQLALAITNQHHSKQRGRYMCSGESLENIPFPWPQTGREESTDKQRVQSNVPEDNETSLSNEESKEVSEDSRDCEANFENKNMNNVDQMPCNSQAEDVNQSANVSCDQELKTILHGHSDLNLDAYCHFTSPIRRYIDIIVHRLVVNSIENKVNTLDPEEVTELCDRSTFIQRNSKRFDREAKKLHLAVNLQSSSRFVSAFIEEIQPDALKLFFGTGEFSLLSGTSVRVARLGPDKNPEEKEDHIILHWTFRLLRLDTEGRAQPRLQISDDDEDLTKTLESQVEDDELSKESSEVSDNDFNYTVKGEDWKEVLDAVKNQNEDELKSNLQKMNDEVQKQRKPKSPVEITPLKKIHDDPSLSSKGPYQHPNMGKPEPSVKETDEFLKVTRSFKAYHRVKVQISSQVNRGVLSPAIQLFQITDKIHACVEHRSFPTTCFAKTSYKRPTNTDVSDIKEYIRIWKPVLMLEIATSAVREDDVITFSNLRVNLAQDSSGPVTMEFKLSNDYIMNHGLDPLDLNLMCVRVKNPDASQKGSNGFWVGHFQISKELKQKKDEKKLNENAKKSTSAPNDNDVQANESVMEDSTSDAEKDNNVEAKSNASEEYEYRTILARLIQSSAPVPELFIAQKYCHVTAELIMLNISDRRRLGAVVHSEVASELVQQICIGKVTTEPLFEPKVQRNLSLSHSYPTLQNFHPLNRFQRDAVEKALTQPFTLIQGPPGTGKTVTGVHIAYWFAQSNKRKLRSVKDESKGSMVFYCGPSNKSVDVVARYLMKIPGLKILRVYGQEIERKVFPVPDKITLFRSKRVSVQLKADEDLKDVSLHHVIRSRDCPYAREIKDYDEEFKKYTGYNSNAPRRLIGAFNKVKSDAEKWAMTGVDVILVTCTTAYSHRIIAPCEGFVCQCIVDECGMCIEAETLCAMLGSNANQVVLIGDHKQLQPVIQCDKAKDLGLGISMFERFSEKADMLQIQYRMHENLCKFPSEFFYEDKLETADEVKRRQPDNVKIWPKGSNYPFVFYNVEGKEESLVVSTDQGNENSKKNQKEIRKVVRVARQLANDGIKDEDILVLSPYRAQCFEIREELKKHNLKDISVTTVVEAQGSERNYVILSLVRSLPKREIEKNPSRSWLMEHLGFITDEHQINVALTRAKRGLCIVGNANLIGVCSMWRELLEHYEKNECLMTDIW